jgi:hypothetical protein
MFYFLEAIRAPPLCRTCLVAAEIRAGLPAPFHAPDSISRFPRGSEGSPTPARPGPGGGRYFPFFEEYLGDVDAALRELPQNSPLFVVSQQLRAVAIRTWDRGEVTPALQIIRRLWSRLRELNLLSPFWSEDSPGDSGEPYAEPLLPETPGAYPTEEDEIGESRTRLPETEATPVLGATLHAGAVRVREGRARGSEHPLEEPDLVAWGAPESGNPPPEGP